MSYHLHKGDDELFIGLTNMGNEQCSGTQQCLNAGLSWVDWSDVTFLAPELKDLSISTGELCSVVNPLFEEIRMKTATSCNGYTNKESFLCQFECPGELL